jgi:hypothetical protein
VIKQLKLILSPIEEEALNDVLNETGHSFADLVRTRLIRDRVAILIKNKVKKGLSSESQANPVVRLVLKNEESFLMGALVEQTGLSSQDLFKYALFGRNIVARKDDHVDRLKLRELKGTLTIAKNAIDSNEEGTLSTLGILIEGMLEDLKDID